MRGVRRSRSPVSIPLAAHVARGVEDAQIEQPYPPTGQIVVQFLDAIALRAKRKEALSLVVEGVAETAAIILIHSTKPPRSVELAGGELAAYEYSAKEGLLWIRFTNQAVPRTLNLRF